MTQKTPRIHDIEKVVHGNKIKSVFTAVPFTTIKNEQGQSRKIADLSQNLKASMGIERVHIKSLSIVDNEFGPNGEQVWQTGSKDPRVRFVGSWNLNSDSAGTRAQTLVVNDYAEITFYGTGLNLLGRFISGTHDVRVTIDNGAEGSSIIPASLSSILDSRNYDPNILLKAASGLSLGWHTAKIRMAANSLALFGFEILNESSQVVVNQGQPFAGSLAASLISQQLIPYKPSTLTGAKGGRVVVYNTEDGTIGQAVTIVDASAQYLSSASHANEEIVRKINFREFGRNRGDDFSTAAGAVTDRAFTLDDGTTTLVAYQVTADQTGGEYNLRAGAGGFITITFVGTGLDLRLTTNNADVRTTNIYVDNTSVGSYVQTANETARVVSICSGLPYGTHTVKLEQTGAFNTLFLGDFIIYQPKKPTLPEGTIEIAEYNVMADFVGKTTSLNGEVSQGVLRKNPTREFTYKGTWVTPSLDVTFFNSGWNIRTTTAASSVEYSFFGTGADLVLAYDSVDIVNWTVEVDDTTPLLAGASNALIPAAGTGLTFADSGTVTGTGTGSKLVTLRLTNLPLGLHKIKITNNSTTEMYIDGVDIITPIYTNSKDLKTGSLSLLDMRQDQQIEESSKKVDLSRAKAWVIFNGVSGEEKIYGSYNISAILRTGTGEWAIYFKKPFKHTGYAVSGSADGENYFTGPLHPSSDTTAKTTSYCKVKSFNAAGGNEDERHISVIIYGELEGEENLNLEDL